jgi:excinuclease UvrABC nuclease subunit
MTNGLNWKTICPAREDPPALPGVYVIFVNGQVAYVGSSMNMRARFVGHKFRFGFARNIHTPWGSFPDTSPGGSDAVTCKFRTSRRLGDWLMWEFRLIRRLQPIFNARSKREWAA